MSGNDPVTNEVGELDGGTVIRTGIHAGHPDPRPAGALRACNLIILIRLSNPVLRTGPSVPHGDAIKYLTHFQRAKRASHGWDAMTHGWDAMTHGWDAMTHGWDAMTHG